VEWARITYFFFGLGIATGLALLWLLVRASKLRL
jgi:hypothetical protein